MNKLSVNFETEINASPRTVWHKLINEANLWWEQKHQKGSQMVFEDKCGGTFREEFEAGGGVVHGWVQYVIPEKMMILRGPANILAPNSGVIKFILENEGSDSSHPKCLLKFTHEAFGLFSDELAECHDKNWKESISGTFKKYCESDSHSY